MRDLSRILGAAALSAAFALITLRLDGWGLHWLGKLPLLVALSLVIVSDLASHRAPDQLTLPMLAYALMLSALSGIASLGQAALGALVGGGVVLLAAVLTRGAIGGGDIKLMAALGAAIGWKASLVALAATQLVGGVVAIALIVTRRAGRKSDLPVGAIIALFGALILCVR